MKELAGQVRFAAEIYDDRTLDQAIQRELNEGRVKKEIVSFLKRRADRSFLLSLLPLSAVIPASIQFGKLTTNSSASSRIKSLTRPLESSR